MHILKMFHVGPQMPKRISLYCASKNGFSLTQFSQETTEGVDIVMTQDYTVTRVTADAKENYLLETIRFQGVPQKPCVLVVTKKDGEGKYTKPSTTWMYDSILETIHSMFLNKQHDSYMQIEEKTHELSN